MHIIALASYLSSKRGGLEISLLDVCRSLAERGHTITLVYEQEGDQLESYQQFCRQLIKVSGYRISPKFLFDVYKIGIDQDTIIYSNQYDNFFFAATLSRLRGVPLACHLRLHASTEDLWPKRVKQSLTLKGIDRCIAISQAVKVDWIEKLGIPGDRIDVVFNGIHPDAFTMPESLASVRQQWGLPETAKVISYAGRLETCKGIETLLKSFALLLKSGREARLLIAGKPLISGDEYRDSLQQLARDLGVSEHVQFLGHVSNTQALYQASDITVLPSLWLEAFGRVVIEAMACGTPVVASRVGGIPEILTGEFQPWLVEPDNAQELCDRLQHLLDWRETDPSLSQRCREHVVRNFNLERTINGVEDILLKTARSYPASVSTQSYKAS